MSHLPGGMFPAFLTPLDADRRVNRTVAEQLFLHLMGTGMDGVYLAGTTGEGMRLPVSERKALLETVKPLAPAGKHVFVHVGAPTLHDTLELAEHAAHHGADAISSLPPQGDAAAIQHFYETVAAASPLPLILYYFPKAAPHAFPDTARLLDLLAVPNIAGVKFTDFNTHLLHTLVERGATVYNGYDEALACGLLMGADGGIGSTYNVMPELYLGIHNAAKQGAWETARQLQFRANRVIDTMLRYPFFPALRAVMEERGFALGPMLSGEAFTGSQDRSDFLTQIRVPLYEATNAPSQIARWVQNAR